jgi:hypothetical protein
MKSDVKKWKKIIKNQRKKYLRKSRKSWSFRPFVAKSSSAKMLAKVWRKRGSGEKFYGANLSIYRGEGVVSRNCLDMTVARNPEKSGGRVSTPTFRG